MYVVVGSYNSIIVCFSVWALLVAEAGCLEQEDWTCPPRNGFTLTSPYEFLKEGPDSEYIVSERVPNQYDPRTNQHCGYE